MSSDLAEWLLEQVARDENAARALPHAVGGLESRFSPAKLIADCDAKRRIIEEYRKEAWVMEQGHRTGWTEGGQAARESVLRFLALPYADRVGYRTEWRVDGGD